MPAAIRSVALPPLADPGLSEADYAKLASVLNSRLGIKLPSAKRGMLEMRMRARMRELGYADHDAYCRHLFYQGGLAAEMQHLVDAVTTNKTDFFREPEHFTALRELLVPSLLASRRAEHKPCLKIWSAAASIGAEAYTIAMVLEDMLRARSGFRYAVLGTDVSTRVLEQAIEAIYSTELIMPIPAVMKDRYLMHPLYRSQNPVVRIVPELRRNVSFAPLNLMDASYPFDRDVDIVFLRNVLIYFEREDQEAVIRRLMGHLRPGGYIVLGHSEAAIGSTMGLNQVFPAIFQKV
jgi:chemotaxis protein methyltransferase CheR